MNTKSNLLIVPAYNEAGAVASVVEEALALDGFDVLVVDDGSSDATAAVARAAGARVLELPFNLGIGGAVQAGYRYAAAQGYAVAIQCDGDGQHPPSEAPGLVEAMREHGADFVVGSRFLGEVSYRPTGARLVAIRWLRGVLRVLSGQRFTDPTSGYRAAGPAVIEAFAHWYPDDYPEPEVLLLLARRGFAVVEVPVLMRERGAGETSIPFVKGLFYILKVTAALGLDLTRRPWRGVAAR